jgi:hypothetical protein
MGGTDKQQAIARKQAGWWTKHANLKFAFDNRPDADIRISFDPKRGAWSWLGTDCRRVPLNDATMNLGFLDGGTAAHEFGHAIGLAHEHQSPHGGIQWREAVVIKAMAKDPNFWNEETTRRHIIEKYEVNQINGTAFDPDSIMIYAIPPEWTEDGFSTEVNHALSDRDRQFVASSQMYPPKPSTLSGAATMNVNARRRTRAVVGMVGEEDLFRFTAVKQGYYIVDTRGANDVVMKLFGPGSETALIAEDDTYGLGLDARIGVPLIEGEYSVQVRHYNYARAAGEYSIHVRSN